MEGIIALLGPILEELLQIAASASTGQISNIIAMIEKFIEVAVSAVPTLIPSLQNIIAALSSNGQVSADQLTQLQAQSAALDAALDVAAKDDNLSGV